eukprot:g65.t1
MEEENQAIEDAIGRTIRILGPVLSESKTSLTRKAPKVELKRKLLSRPPFRFILKIIVRIIITTGSGEGLYSERVLDAAMSKSKAKVCFPDRFAKKRFLERYIGYLNLVLKTALDVSSGEILAGVKPSKTNTFLTAIAEASECSQDERSKAVQSVLDLERVQSIFLTRRSHACRVIQQFWINAKRDRFCKKCASKKIQKRWKRQKRRRVMSHRIKSLWYRFKWEVFRKRMHRGAVSIQRLWRQYCYRKKQMNAHAAIIQSMWRSRSRKKNETKSATRIQSHWRRHVAQSRVQEQKNELRQSIMTPLYADDDFEEYGDDDFEESDDEEQESDGSSETDEPAQKPSKDVESLKEFNSMRKNNFHQDEVREEQRNTSEQNVDPRRRILVQKSSLPPSRIPKLQKKTIRRVPLREKQVSRKPKPTIVEVPAATRKSQHNSLTRQSMASMPKSNYLKMQKDREMAIEREAEMRRKKRQDRRRRATTNKPWQQNMSSKPITSDDQTHLPNKTSEDNENLDPGSEESLPLKKRDPNEYSKPWRSQMKVSDVETVEAMPIKRKGTKKQKKKPRRSHPWLDYEWGKENRSRKLLNKKTKGENGGVGSKKGSSSILFPSLPSAQPLGPASSGNRDRGYHNNRVTVDEESPLQSYPQHLTGADIDKLAKELESRISADIDDISSAFMKKDSEAWLKYKDSTSWPGRGPGRSRGSRRRHRMKDGSMASEYPAFPFQHHHEVKLGEPPKLQSYVPISPVEDRPPLPERKPRPSFHNRSNNNKIERERRQIRSKKTRKGITNNETTEDKKKPNRRNRVSRHKDDKPWQQNMKKRNKNQPQQDEEGRQDNLKKSKAEEKRPPRKKTESKPWQHNMKRNRKAPGDAETTKSVIRSAKSSVTSTTKSSTHVKKKEKGSKSQSIAVVNRDEKHLSSSEEKKDPSHFLKTEQQMATSKSPSQPKPNAKEDSASVDVVQDNNKKGSSPARIEMNKTSAKTASEERKPSIFMKPRKRKFKKEGNTENASNVKQQVEKQSETKVGTSTSKSLPKSMETNPEERRAEKVESKESLSSPGYSSAGRQVSPAAVAPTQKKIVEVVSNQESSTFMRPRRRGEKKKATPTVANVEQKKEVPIQMNETKIGFNTGISVEKSLEKEVEEKNKDNVNVNRRAADNEAITGEMPNALATKKPSVVEDMDYAFDFESDGDDFEDDNDPEESSECFYIPGAR